MEDSLRNAYKLLIKSVWNLLVTRNYELSLAQSEAGREMCERLLNK